MKRNTLTTAVLAGLTGMAGMVSVSNATGVHVNPEGTGQVLIYPFYTARGGNTTLVSIVNTNERGKAVKVRFREALNSREVLDFNLYLSPYDVWVAAVQATEDGGAILKTDDTSCTVPAIDGSVEFLDFDFAQKAVASQFAGTIDGAGTDIERTASGYIEVIEMGTMVSRFDEANKELKAPSASNPLVAGHIEWAAKHNADGVPNSCATLVNAWTNYTDVAAASIPLAGGKWLDAPGFGLDAPSGGLFGSASIINISSGTMFSFNAVALENFWASTDIAAASDKDDSIHAEPGIDFPNLASTNNKTSHVLFRGELVDQTFDRGIQAVTAALAQATISNEYVTDARIGAQTEWVVTFPTKAYHVDRFQAADGAGDPRGGAVGTDGKAVAPFTGDAWRVGATAAAFSPACESFNVRFWDREEQGPAEREEEGSDDPVTPVRPVFSPREFQPTQPAQEQTFTPEFTLCSEANVIAFSDKDTEIEVGDASGILGEPARAKGLGLVNFGLDFDSGWAEINLVNAIGENTGTDVDGVKDLGERVSTSANNVIKGLPVVGFAVTTYTNGELAGGVLANYGGTFNHRGSRSIAAS